MAEDVTEPGPLLLVHQLALNKGAKTSPNGKQSRGSWEKDRGRGDVQASQKEAHREESLLTKDKPARRGRDTSGCPRSLGFRKQRLAKAVRWECGGGKFQARPGKETVNTRRRRGSYGAQGGHSLTPRRTGWQPRQIQHGERHRRDPQGRPTGTSKALMKTLSGLGLKESYLPS